MLRSWDRKPVSGERFRGRAGGDYEEEKIRCAGLQDENQTQK
jgi:hypothetical protein